MNSETDILLEPAKAYKSVYKTRFEENASKMFDELVSASGIDAESNRRTAAEYRKKNAELEKHKGARGRLKAWRVVTIIFAILGLLVLIGGISNGNLLLAIISGVVSAGCFVLWFALLNPKIKSANERIQKMQAEVDRLYGRAMELISPLLARFTSNMTFELIRLTVPTLEIDDNFNMKRYDYFSGKYGLPDHYDDETSVVGIISGEINGNPYIVERLLRHKMGTQVYTGSKTIHWTTYSRNSNGKTVAHHHTQVLTASVVKPKPFYSTATQLIYGNDAAPDLSFSRKAGHNERLSEKKLKSKVKSETKKIRNKAKKKMASGFTEVGNEEFDALFNALDRDNEVQFRLLFTPLAQKNMLELIKGNSPFGDDFEFSKSKCLNFIRSEHAQNWNIDTDPVKYRSYDVDISKKQFIYINSEYFKSFFFDMAPLLAIPLYQQIKPKEYIYGTSYKQNYTTRESEILANKMGYGRFAHPAGETQAILKTRIDQRCGDVDRLIVTAYSYRTISRIDFATRMGGDGRLHAIPIPWIQYVAVSKETGMSMNCLNMDETEYNSSGFARADGSAVFYHKLYAVLGDDGELFEDEYDEPDPSERIDLSQIDEDDDDDE